MIPLRKRGCCILFIIIIVYVHVCAYACMCVHICVNGYVNVCEGKKLALAVLLYCFPPYQFLEQDLSQSLMFIDTAKLAGQ